MSITNELKTFIGRYHQSISPLELVPAEVITVNPLSIRLGDHQKLVIPHSLITIAQHLREHTRLIRVDGEDKQMRFYNDLSPGNRVMVAVLQGGQSIFVIDKI
ncbi:DUF2577 family protein [Alkalihalobacillus trypoxylicola]|uniref:Phage portal protein n=1 Tax=Alkalihalobacillus trypoxylicola TaxID=519424 RepID=A0A161PKD0_9BACI|nr:DUF2577 family protein [Alkalihalobacillus trypoxylicola]KYG33889.1 phage portal protein [Alkalihalobacillus trypoxylicola]